MRGQRGRQRSAESKRLHCRSAWLEEEEEEEGTGRQRAGAAGGWRLAGGWRAVGGFRMALRLPPQALRRPFASAIRGAGAPMDGRARRASVQTNLALVGCGVARPGPHPSRCAARARLDVPAAASAQHLLGPPRGPGLGAADLRLLGAQIQGGGPAVDARRARRGRPLACLPRCIPALPCGCRGDGRPAAASSCCRPPAAAVSRLHHQTIYRVVDHVTYLEPCLNAGTLRSRWCMRSKPSAGCRTAAMPSCCGASVQMTRRRTRRTTASRDRSLGPPSGERRAAAGWGHAGPHQQSGLRRVSLPIWRQPRCLPACRRRPASPSARLGCWGVAPAL